MTAKTIIYFDKVYDEFKERLMEQAPEGYDLWFWHDI